MCLVMKLLLLDSLMDDIIEYLSGVFLSLYPHEQRFYVRFWFVFLLAFDFSSFLSLGDFFRFHSFSLLIQLNSGYKGSQILYQVSLRMIISVIFSFVTQFSITVCHHYSWYIARVHSSLLFIRTPLKLAILMTSKICLNLGDWKCLNTSNLKRFLGEVFARSL